MADATKEPITYSPTLTQTGNILDFVLDDDSTIESLTNVSQSDDVSSTHQGSFAPSVIKRTKTRVLFVSTDPILLEANTELRNKLASLSSVFDEIHIMVVEKAWKKRKTADKIAEGVWVYSTTAKQWWHTMREARELVKEQLEFTDGFRPDIIVGLDPFEAGYIAKELAEDYGRPFQIHVLEDFLSEDYKRTERYSKWRLRLAKHVLNKTTSVCVTSEAIKNRIKKQFTHIQEPILLPRYYNIKSILEQTNTPTVKPSKLANFKFIMLYIGKLNHDSTLYRAIDAARTVLRSPSIALVVIGEGPMKKEFQKRAEIFGIKEQIIFEPSTVDQVSYMRASDLLISTDITPDSEESVIKAAAVGLPLLLARTDLRDDIFTDEANAFVCEPEDTIGFAQKLSKFLNNNGIRSQFSREARTTIKDRLHEDPEIFKFAYKDAIESVFATKATARGK
ncbi:glycosyltransferase [Candidatus Kaiserbacteria bacterium]|nr:glycosyltransferase [Candidatus Kaiserbacteria bacterium]